MAKLGQDLLDKLGQWRSSGKIIVFTNGVFDLLHPSFKLPGHAAMY